MIHQLFMKTDDGVVDYHSFIHTHQIKTLILNYMDAHTFIHRYIIVAYLRSSMPVLLLPYIVVEMGRHFEVVSFVRQLCSETVDAFLDG